jgi:hypothetical protein
LVLMTVMMLLLRRKDGGVVVRGPVAPDPTPDLSARPGTFFTLAEIFFRGLF